jgi:hypothetical protein
MQLLFNRNLAPVNVEFRVGMFILNLAPEQTRGALEESDRLDSEYGCRILIRMGSITLT